MSPTYNDPGALAGATGAGIVVAEGQRRPNNTSRASSPAWRHLITVHPAADLFPMGSDAELDELATDIETNGLRSPLSLWRSLPEAELQLLDGRNRVAAMARLVDGQDMVKGAIGAANQYEAQVDPVAFVISANIHRRHLDESQRSMVAARLANLQRGGVGGITKTNAAIAVLPPVSQAKAATLLNVSVDSVQRAAVVQREGSPELVKQVERGVVSVSIAAKSIKAAKLPSKESQLRTMREHQAKAGPTPSPSLKRDTTIGHICAWLRADLKGALDDLVRILRDEQDRIANLPMDRRIIGARGLLQALGVTADDLKRGVP
jgi:hypothetical protein